MPSFVIKEWWAENRTTRNAFYHAISIAENLEVNAKTVQVMHYGSMKVAEGEFSRPVRGGQLKVSGANAGKAHSDSICRNKMNEKRAGGYSSNEGTRETTSDTLAKFDAWLLATFGASPFADDIRRHFGISTVRTVTDDPVIDPHYPTLTGEDDPVGWEDTRGTW